MTHHSASMAQMESPADAFCEAIAWVDDSLDFLQEELTSLLPVLYGKVLDVNMAQSFGGTIGVDHLDSELIVVAYGSGPELGESKLGKNGSDVFCDFPRGDSSKEFGLSTAGCGDRLGLGPMGDNTTSK